MLASRIRPGRGRCRAIRRRMQITGVLLIVAIETQEFPVAAIGMIIVMIMVSVVDREFVNILVGKLPSAWACSRYPRSRASLSRRA